MKQSSINKIESRVVEIDSRLTKVLAENTKDLKELKSLFGELESLKETLNKELRDRLLSLMPAHNDPVDNSGRIKVLEEYFKILGSYVGINKYNDINILIYRMEEPEDLGEFCLNLKELLNLFETYNIILTPTSFDISLSVISYMQTFYEVKDNDDYLSKMKVKFDELYWENHDILKDIVLNIRIIIFSEEENLLKELSLRKNKYVKDNNVDEDKARDEYNSLKLEQSESASTNAKCILENIKKNIINVDALSKDSSLYMDAVKMFVTEEHYSLCNKDEFILNIRNLKNNLTEFKYYEKFKYLIGTIGDMISKKEEYKTVYTTKRNNIKKEIDNKNKKFKSLISLLDTKKKVSSKKITFLFSESTRVKTLDKIDKKIHELNKDINASIQNLKSEFNEYDLSLFREKATQSINKSYTILDDFSLFNNNVFVLIECIKEYELNLTKKEYRDLYYLFHDFIMLPTIQIINTFDFSKEEDVALSIINKYKLIDINFELNVDNVDELINCCQTIINAFDVGKSGLDPDIIKYIDKYIIVRDNESA